MAAKPKRYPQQGCPHFITFSCYQRRKLLGAGAPSFRAFAKGWAISNAQLYCVISNAVPPPYAPKLLVAPDISTCDFMAGSEDQQIYLQTGIRACQTTPLIGCGGNVVGMISTHWRKPHEPSDDELRLFDILAKGAADVIERCRRDKS